MEVKNSMKIIFDSKSENESFARVAVTAFLSQMNPTLEEIEDVRTAISEAVTNAIIHGYEQKDGEITMISRIREKEFYIEIQDAGIGIEDVEKAMEPLFTTKPEMERSGLGFVFMQSFMDQVEVESELGKGTTVKMTKQIKKG